MARQYTPRVKFQIVMEVLRDNKKPSQVAKAYAAGRPAARDAAGRHAPPGGVHPNSVNKWTKTILEEGPELFAKDGTVASTSAVLRSWNVCWASRRYRSRF